MRKITTALVSAALAATGIAAAAPASAAVEILKDPTVKVIDPFVGASTDAVVKVKLHQMDYRNISLNLAFPGFHANNAFAYRKGACPAWVAHVVVPPQVSVKECGWDQEGPNATLRLALQGPMASDSVKVRVKAGSLTAPSSAGIYGVMLSSWAFADVTADAEIFDWPVK